MSVTRGCLGAAALAAVLAARGSGETEVASGNGTTTSTAAAPTTTTSIIVGADGSRHVRHVGAWRFGGQDESGRTLSIVVPVSGCTKFQEIEVDERPDRVQLTALVETFLEGPPGGEPEVACSQELGWRQVTVELAAPLGERQLLGECAPAGPGDVDCSSLAR